MMTTKPMSRSSSRTRSENLHSYAYKGQEYAYMQATGRRSRNSSPSVPRSPIVRNGSTAANGNNYGLHGGNYRGVPPEPEVDYVDPFSANKNKQENRKSIVNGVKVMFNIKNKDGKRAEEVTTKINSPYSHFQPRPRSISPIKIGSTSNGSETGRKDHHQQPSPVPTSGNEIVLRNTVDEHDDSLDDDASVKIVPVEIWDSGQVLVANTNNREQSCTTIPGEGKLMKTSEERSQVWRHKTRRKYHETVKKDKPSRDGSENGSRTSQMSTTRKMNGSSKPKTIEYTTPKTDDDKLYSAQDLDDVFLNKKRHALEQEREIAKHVRWTEHDCQNHGHTNTSTQYSHTNSSSIINGHNNHSSSRKEGSDDYFPYLDSYLPRMEDKSTQCNIPKPHKSKRDSRFEISQDFRVIKSKKDGSVSTYSDVPPMAGDDKPPPLVKLNGNSRSSNGVIYSQVTTRRPTETTRRPVEATVTKTVTREVELTPEPQEYVYEANPTRSVTYRMQSRSPSPLISRRKASPSPLLRRKQTESPVSRSRTKTKTYGFNMSNALGPDVTPKRGAAMQPPDEWYAMPSTHLSEEHAIERQKRAYERSLARETIEETISISNASSDEMSVRNGHVGHVDERQGMNSVVREIDEEKKTMTYENPNSRGRTNQQSALYENNASGIWFKALDEDYRRGMAKSEVSFPAIGLTSDEPPVTSYATMSRTNKRSPPEQIQRLDYERSSPMQAYTLDRRYLEERKRNKASSLKQGPVMGRREMIENGFGQSASDRCGPTTSTMRRFASQRSVFTSDGLNGDLRRGGLAAAYRTRQKRASSLNRSSDRGSLTGSQYRLAQESDPVVMYIPAVSHQSVKFDEDDRMSGLQLARSQSILSTAKRPPKYKSKNGKDENRNVTIASGYQVMSHPNGHRDMDDDSDSRTRKLSKKDLKRSHSMPLSTQKETKFPWLQKLGIKVKAREP